MTSLITDIYEALKNDAGLAALSVPVYARKPVKIPGSAFVTVTRQNFEQQIANYSQRIRVIIFSEDTELLETLSNLIREFLVGKQLLNSNEYYQVAFLSQGDGDQPLDSGHYWNIQQYEISESY